MNIAIKILKKELKEWKQELESDLWYYRDFMEITEAKKNIKRDKKNIQDLKEAINILNKNNGVHFLLDS